VIEELFQNMTLSLISDALFFEPATENITVEYERVQNIYAYNSRNLLLSYGLVLGFALTAVTADCVSICYNGASYSNKFSTILRATRGQNLEELVALNDQKGAGPLPSYLAKARIRFGDAELFEEVTVSIRSSFGRSWRWPVNRLIWWLRSNTMISLTQLLGKSISWPAREGSHCIHKVTKYNANLSVGSEQGLGEEPRPLNCFHEVTTGKE
jgi:hypothetical protein